MAGVVKKQQKIIRVGNSVAITLDKEYLNTFKVNVGDPVTVTYYSGVPLIKLNPPDKHTETVVLHEDMVKEEHGAYLASEITPEFRTWVQTSLEEDKEAMKDLAHL